MTPKILIMDENAFLRETTRSMLEKRFPALRVLEASDGLDGFVKIHEQWPDIILMDINLPGDDGLQLIRRVREEYPEIVVIIFTNHDQSEYRQAAFALGIDFFLSKTSREGDRLIPIVESIISDKENADGRKT